MTPLPADSNLDSGQRRPRNRSPRDGLAVLVTGSRGAGKTTWVMQQIKPADELLVWDTLGQWTAELKLQKVSRLQALHDLIQAQLGGAATPSRVGYVGEITRGHFDTFCRLAWVWIRAGRGRVLVVEELADVTSPGKAPAAWGHIVRKGRHTGGRLYACTQRPAESDKTIAGNADVIHCGRQSFPRDRKSISEYLDVDVADVSALRSLEWIERDMRSRELRRGIVTF